MNKLILIVIAAFVLGGVAYFLYSSRASNIQKNYATPLSNAESTQASDQTSNYIDYSKSSYEKALADKKTVMLYFTANWCPICRDQEPINVQVMKDLEPDGQILAIRVHILDSETTKETENLAEKFGVTYQHTFVILGENGEVYFKYTGPLTNEEIKNRLQEASKGGERDAE